MLSFIIQKLKYWKQKNSSSSKSKDSSRQNTRPPTVPHTQLSTSLKKT